MDQEAIDKIKKEEAEDEEEKVKTFGVIPKNITRIPKHNTEPKVVTHKSQIDK